MGDYKDWYEDECQGFQEPWWLWVMVASWIGMFTTYAVLAKFYDAEDSVSWWGLLPLVIWVVVSVVWIIVAGLRSG